MARNKKASRIQEDFGNDLDHLEDVRELLEESDWPWLRFVLKGRKGEKYINELIYEGNAVGPYGEVYVELRIPPRFCRLFSAQWFYWTFVHRYKCLRQRIKIKLRIGTISDKRAEEIKAGINREVKDVQSITW